MSMSGHDILNYQYFEKRSIECGFSFTVNSEGIKLYDPDGCILGSFIDISECLSYIYGYERGFTKGRLSILCGENLKNNKE